MHTSNIGNTRKWWNLFIILYVLHTERFTIVSWTFYSYRSFWLFKKLCTRQTTVYTKQIPHSPSWDLVYLKQTATVDFWNKTKFLLVPTGFSTCTPTPGVECKHQAVVLWWLKFCSQRNLETCPQSLLCHLFPFHALHCIIQMKALFRNIP